LAASRVSSCRPRRALALRPSRAREVRSGVDRIAAPPPPVARAHHHLEVQMRLAPMSVASRADGANHLAADETGVLRKPVTIRSQVGVVVDELFARVGCIYREPTLAVPLQSEHTPIVSGQDRCSAWCGDVDGAVDTGSAARGSKVVGDLIWRHARDGHHELPRAERTVEGRLASGQERAPRDLKRTERPRAPSAPSPVHLTAAFAIASVRAPRRFGYHSHFASAGGVGFARGTSISGGSRSPFLNSCIPFPRLPIISGNRPGPKTSRTTTRTTTNSPMPMPNMDADHRSASHQPQRLVILWPDRLRQDTAPSTEPSTPLTARRLLQRRQPAGLPRLEAQGHPRRETRTLALRTRGLTGSGPEGMNAAELGRRGHMPKVAPFHSAKEPHHHDNSKCGPGSEIPAHNKLPGTGGKPLCKDCKKLNDAGQ